VRHIPPRIPPRRFALAALGEPGTRLAVPATHDSPADPSPLYSPEEIQLIRVRGKARALTALCITCGDLAACSFGQRLEKLYLEFCQPQVGNDFRRCWKCSRTLDGTCGVDLAALADDLHEQLATCTRKRRFEMPFNIARWDVLFES